jgi:hypothetical protein
LIISIIIFFIPHHKRDDDFYNDIAFEEGNIYLFFRETDSKVGRIAKSYNVNNASYSHVAIGAIINNKLEIIHILPSEENKKRKNKKTELLVQTIDQFYHPKKDSVKSARILHVENVSPLDFKNFLNAVSLLKSRKIFFDEYFSTKPDSLYYCSELVQYILESTDKKFHIFPIKVKISGIDAMYLHRDSLLYFPVDQFINNKNFTTIKYK